MAAAQEAMLRPVTWGDAGGHGADTRNHPVGMHGDEFDKMFGAAGMGGHETQRQTRASVPAGPVRDLRGVEQQQIDSYTSSHERIYYELEQQGHARQMPAEPETGYLHPDTLMPMPRGASVHRGERPVDGGWAVGFVVADGGVIRKIVPQAPADRAELVQESTEGVWEGKCCVGDRVNSSLPLLAPLAAFWITPMQPSTCPTGFCNGVTDTWLSSCCSAVLCQCPKIVEVDGEGIGVGMEKKAFAQVLGKATARTSALRLTLVRPAKVFSILPAILGSGL